MNFLKNHRILLGIFLFLFVLLSAYFRFLPVRQPISSNEVSDVRYLRTEDMEFKNGYAHLVKGEYSSAVHSFELSLNSAQNLYQESYIKFYIAMASGLARNYEKAISDFKSIAKNENYNDPIRARAVAYMGELYYRSLRDPQVSVFIFSTEPYSKLLVKGDENASYRNLFDYAKSIYPVSEATYWIAVDESYKAVPLIFKETPLSAGEEMVVEGFKTIVENALMSLNDEILFLENSNTVSVSLSEYYLRRANIFALSWLFDKTLVSSTESDYVKAKELAQSSAEQLLKVNYQYAYYLSLRYGDSKAAQIHDLLSVFYDPAYQQTDFYKSLFAPHSFGSVRMKKTLIAISAVDKDFALMLSKKGWSLK